MKLFQHFLTFFLLWTAVATPAWASGDCNAILGSLFNGLDSLAIKREKSWNEPETFDQYRFFDSEGQQLDFMAVEKYREKEVFKLAVIDRGGEEWPDVYGPVEGILDFDFPQGKYKMTISAQGTPLGSVELALKDNNQQVYQLCSSQKGVLGNIGNPSKVTHQNEFYFQYDYPLLNEAGEQIGLVRRYPSLLRPVELANQDLVVKFPEEWTPSEKALLLAAAFALKLDCF